jgi:hypothetical protein
MSEEEEEQFTDAVGSLANQEFPFWCHNESPMSLNKEIS